MRVVDTSLRSRRWCFDFKWVTASNMNDAKLLFETILSGLHGSVIDLVLAGADPNLVLPEGAAPIHLAAGSDSVPSELVKLLLRHGADPNLQSSEGDTPLHVSAAYGRCDVLRLLLQSGADPDVQNLDGQRAADLARQSGCAECMLTIQDFTELKNDQQRDDDVTAFSVRPYEPDQLLPFSPSLSYSSQDVTLPCQDDDGQINKILKEEESDDTFSSASSFHTCPSDGDVTILPGPEVRKRGIANGKTTKNCHLEMTNETKSVNENTLVDDSISSRGTEDFLPTDFDSDDLSIDLKHKVDLDRSNREISAAKVDSLTKSNIGRIQSDVVESNKDQLHSRWFSQLRSLWHRPHANLQLRPSTKSIPEDDSAKGLTRDGTKLNQQMYGKVAEMYTSDESEVEDQIRGDKISNSQRQTWSNLGSRNHSYLRKLDDNRVSTTQDQNINNRNIPITSSRSSADICRDLENLSLSTINDSQCKMTSARETILQKQVERQGPKVDSFFKRPIQSQSNGHYPGPEECPPLQLNRRNSSASSVGSIQYLYTDTEDGYSLVETWYPIDDEPQTPSPLPSESPTSLFFTPTNCSRKKPSPSICLTRQQVECQQTTSGIGKERNGENGRQRDTTDHVSRIDTDIIKMSDAELRTSLKAIGSQPGPVTATTRAAYEAQLMKYRLNPALVRPATGNVYFPEIQCLLEGDLCTSLLQGLEDEMARPFYDLQPSRKWREGTKKSSFNYLLLDPRITENIPARVKLVGDEEAFRDFIMAIFYVGKGKRARPYAHFKEAISHVNGCNKKAAGAKVQTILDIWNEGHGVISLHVFQNVIPVEAYTREAAMIDALGRQKLTNIKTGEYYGPAASWLPRKRRELGSRLLHKAFRIFLSEGERHIRPADV